MSPRPRLVPSDADRARIEKARQRLEAAEVELEKARNALVQATVTSMKNGASHREAAKVAGVDERTTHRWGKANGWPTAEQLAAREAARKPTSEELLEGFRQMRDGRES